MPAILLTLIVAFAFFLCLNFLGLTDSFTVDFDFATVNATTLEVPGS